MPDVALEEDLASGLRRVLASQIASAIAELRKEETGIDLSVHEARKAIKRARALLRLIRPLARQIYARENDLLRAAGRRLSEFRDAAALIETLRDLNPRAATEFRASYRYLLRRKRETTGAVRIHEVLPEALQRLEDAQTLLEELPFDQVAFPVLVKSLKKSVKRGKRSFAAALEHPDPDRFHECRKRAKDLRFQATLFAELFPGTLDNHADQAKDLEQLLGADHNLAILSEILNRRSDPETLRSAIAARQAELREKAKQVGSQLYAERPKAWIARLTRDNTN